MNAQSHSKSCIVKYFDTPASPTHEDLEKIFANPCIPINSIDCVNWPEKNNNYNALCSFKIIYSQEYLILRYSAKEKEIRATFPADTNSQPWTEDCMELFIIPNPDDGVYFNIEMSCIGYGIVGKGAQRTERERLTSDMLNKILRFSSLGRVPFGDKIISENSPDEFFEWSLIIAIPYEIFSADKGAEMFRGKEIPANVYKCGDKMVNSHYFSWSSIGTPKPNFHTPEFFGKFIFE